MPNLRVPAGYQLQSSINIPPNTKLSPDIEDRRDWGPIRNAIGKQGQDFKDYWHDFRQTYPDIHTAYKVVRDSIMGKAPEPQPAAPVQPIQPAFLANTPVAIPKVGQEKRFPNDRIATWDGHGWVAK